jgi:hypothetical protein
MDFREDLSLKALPRWLPHILQQLRDIGLYPIFVVDELDKVQPRLDLASFIENIQLLRGALNESAFFCFVVDRAQYQQMEEQFWDSTLFTDRLLLSHLPSELRHYVEALAHPDPPQIWQKWAWIFVHRARSQPHRLRDVLARYADGEDPLFSHQNPDSWPYAGELLLQLAVEHVAEHGALYLQLCEQPFRLQLALDVLYLPSILWENGKDVDLEENWVRSQIPLPPEDPFCELLTRKLQELCEILANPQLIQDSEQELALVTKMEPLLISAGDKKYRWKKAYLVG